MTLPDAGSTPAASTNSLWPILASLDDWELGWFLFGATLSNNTALADQARAEQRRRIQTTSAPSPRGVLPEVAPAIQRVTPVH